MAEVFTTPGNTEPQHFYRTHGTCARMIQFDLDSENKVHNVAFMGGCNGNLKAISRLIEGADAQYVIDTLEGNICGNKSTSCGDQLAQALKAALKGE